jgi:hypothetical protein
MVLISQRGGLAEETAMEGLMIEEIIPYFAYGAMINPAIMSAVIGREIQPIGAATLLGYRLRIQHLHQVPLGARAILEKSWGAGFRTYTIERAPDSEASFVSGMIYLLTEDERALVRAWELIPEGWFKEVWGRAIKDGERIVVETEGLRDGQTVSHDTVDNGLPPALLQPVEDYVRVAVAARREFEEAKARQLIYIGE